MVRTQHAARVAKIRNDVVRGRDETRDGGASAACLCHNQCANQTMLDSSISLSKSTNPFVSSSLYVSSVGFYT